MHGVHDIVRRHAERVPKEGSRGQALLLATEAQLLPQVSCVVHRQMADEKQQVPAVSNEAELVNLTESVSECTVTVAPPPRDLSI